MTYLLAVIAGMLGAVVGWFLTSIVALWIAGLLGMSDFEGERAMFAFLGAGPLGGLVSMVASAWMVLRVGSGQPALGPTVARLAMVLGGIVAVVGGGIAVRMLTLDTYSNTLPPALEFELRIPPGFKPPEPSALRVELNTDKNVGEGQITSAWSIDSTNGYVIHGTVSLAFKTSSRLLAVKFPGEPTRLFKLPLSRDPSSTATLGDWQRAAHLDDPSDEQPRPAPADDPIELRYRIRRAGED